MIFSKACEYGVRAMVFITLRSQQGERTRLQEISDEIGAPKAFTAKVLQRLVREEVLHSITGPKGGFFIEKQEIPELKLIQIVQAIDGDKLLESCGLGLPQCNANHPCPVHHKFKKIKEDLREMLTDMDIGRMAQDIDNNFAFLKY